MVPSMLAVLVDRSVFSATVNFRPARRVGGVFDSALQFFVDSEKRSAYVVLPFL